MIASRIAITLGVALRETAREKRKIDFFSFLCLPGLAILLLRLTGVCLKERGRARERQKRAAYTQTHKHAPVWVISEIMNNNQF